jgi:hypothetical protein
MDPFAPPVSDLAGNGQRLLVVLDGLGRITEVGVGIAQVAQMRTFRFPIF